MVDMTQSLGRDVTTTEEVLSLIRGDLRIARALYRGIIAEVRAGRMEADPDLELTDGNDSHAFDRAFEALRASAYSNVTDWAGDEGKVFDKAKVQEFIRLALIAAMGLEGGDDRLPAGALDY